MVAPLLILALGAITSWHSLSAFCSWHPQSNFCQSKVVEILYPTYRSLSSLAPVTAPFTSIPLAFGPPINITTVEETATTVWLGDAGSKVTASPSSEVRAVALPKAVTGPLQLDIATMLQMFVVVVLAGVAHSWANGEFLEESQPKDATVTSPPVVLPVLSSLVPYVEGPDISDIIAGIEAWSPENNFISLDDYQYEYNYHEFLDFNPKDPQFRIEDLYSAKSEPENPYMIEPPLVEARKIHFYDGVIDFEPKNSSTIKKPMMETRKIQIHDGVIDLEPKSSFNPEKSFMIVKPSLETRHIQIPDGVIDFEPENSSMIEKPIVQTQNIQIHDGLIALEPKSNADRICIKKEDILVVMSGSRSREESHKKRGIALLTPIYGPDFDYNKFKSSGQTSRKRAIAKGWNHIKTTLMSDEGITEEAALQRVQAMKDEDTRKENEDAEAAQKLWGSVTKRDKIMAIRFDDEDPVTDILLSIE
jgi:hypothetical protein